MRITDLFFGVDSKSVKTAMLQDWRSWDDDYNKIVQEVVNL